MSTALDDATQQLTPGTVLGAWRISRLLGRGGMGEVYEAENVLTHARRALKVVRAGLMGDDGARARFVREVTLAAEIKHPHVVDASDPLLLGELVVLPMELLEGESLAETLRRGALEPREALALLLPIADAVVTFHERGVIHRDLKPANVFLAKTRDGVVPKILDLGAARRLDDDTHTQQGDVIGSPAYMAPEQAMGLSDLDGRVDVWALGVLLYVMVTGRRPYESDAHGTALAKLLQRRAYAPPESLRSGLCPELLDAITSALRWERAARPDARVFRDALRAAHAAQPTVRESITALPMATAERPSSRTALPVGARDADGTSGAGAATTHEAAPPREVSAEEPLPVVPTSKTGLVLAGATLLALLSAGGWYLLGAGEAPTRSTDLSMGPTSTGPAPTPTQADERAVLVETQAVQPPSTPSLAPSPRSTSTPSTATEEGLPDAGAGATAPTRARTRRTRDRGALWVDPEDCHDMDGPCGSAVVR